jgi:hypothetical protein
MGDLVARVWEFTWVVLGYWYVWVTTVSFLIDQGLSHKYLPKRLIELADEYWPEGGRHQFFKWLCIIGFGERLNR